MKTLIGLLALLAATPLLAQTKQIAHKSHSGTHASIQPDRTPDNFGILPEEWINQPEDTSGNGHGLRISWPTSGEEEPDTIVTAIEKAVEVIPEEIPEPIDTTAPAAWPELSATGQEGTPSAGDDVSAIERRRSGAPAIHLAIVLGLSAASIGFAALRRRTSARASNSN
jgi:hypothetical protein